MQPFEIDLAPAGGHAERDEPANIVIGSNDVIFTRLIRQGSNEPEDHVCAPPGQLAFWLVDNWWRLISECVPSSGQTSDWRLAHDMSSIGGFAWPRLAIWGEGGRIGLTSRSDPAGVVGPVCYLTNALIYVALSAFEDASLRFVKHVADEAAGYLSDWAALQALCQRLEAERADPELAAWRRLEAELGYDVDQAPDSLMAELAKFSAEYGAAAIAEAALATKGADTARVLAQEIETANRQHWQCDLARTAKLVVHIDRDTGDPPWALAEAAAATLRKAAGYPNGPLTNAALSDLLHVRAAAFRTSTSESRVELAYGLRLNTGRRRGEVVSLAAIWSRDRRFEFARALGDAIWSEGETLGPLTGAKSERQKFQRAFAQSLLCPYKDLLAYVGADRSDGALSAAAHHFFVSERVVRALLVNKRDLARRRLGLVFLPTTLAGAEVTFEDAVEAA